MTARRADLYHDGKWAAIEKLSFWFLNSFAVGVRFNKVTSLQTQLHKMQYGGIMDLLIEKRAV